MEKIWLKNYPENVRPEIAELRYRSLSEWFDHCVQRYAHRNAFHSFGCKMSYAYLKECVDQFSSFLLQDLGVSHGDRLAIMLPNCLQCPVCFFGGLQAGMTIVNINPFYTVTELTKKIQDAGVTVIVVLDRFAHTVEKTLAKCSIKHIVVTGLGDLLGVKGYLINFFMRFIQRSVAVWRIPEAWSFRRILRKRYVQREKTPVTLEDVAFLQYTGGTTGISKGSMLTHRNVLSNIQQILEYCADYFTEDRIERVMTCLPLYHIFAMTANCFLFLAIGGENILIADPRRLDALFATWKKHRLTIFIGVSTLFHALAKHSGMKEVDLSALHTVISGGSSLQPSVAQLWWEKTHTQIVEAYGLSETSPAVCITPLSGHAHCQNSVGFPLPSTEIMLIDEQGKQVNIDEPGELCVRGPQVMSCYWNNAEETKNAFTCDGFFKTGDIATISQYGVVRIVDRKKDMIVVSGFNVYPTEVEAVLLAHPGIKEVTVVGLPSAKMGEMVVAVVVLRANVNVTDKEIQAYSRLHLVSYKVPRRIFFRNSLPCSPVGKVLRRVVRADLVEQRDLLSATPDVG